MNKKHYLKKSIIFIIICIVLISLDQITKYAAVNSLTDNTKVLIKNFLSLELVYNNGAAFGILQNQRVLFCIITIILCIIIEFIYIKLPYKDYMPLKAVTIGVFCGACGNLIDRMRTGYVVDFIAFDFGSYSFPRFNMADIYVTVSAFAAIFLLLFIYDDKKLSHILKGERNGV